MGTLHGTLKINFNVHTWCMDEANQEHIPIHITIHLVNFNWFPTLESNFAAKNGVDPTKITEQMLSSMPDDIVIYAKNYSAASTIEPITIGKLSASLSTISFFTDDSDATKPTPSKSSLSEVVEPDQVAKEYGQHP